MIYQTAVATMPLFRFALFRNGFHASWDNVLRDFHLAASHPHDSAMRMFLMKFVALILLFRLAALGASPEEQRTETATGKGQIGRAVPIIASYVFCLTTSRPLFS
jgi:hypothetical protein